MSLTKNDKNRSFRSRKAASVLIALFYLMLQPAYAYRVDTIKTDSSELTTILQTSQEVQDLKNMQREMVLPAPPAKRNDTNKPDPKMILILTVFVLGIGLYWKIYKQKISRDSADKESPEVLPDDRHSSS